MNPMRTRSLWLVAVLFLLAGCLKSDPASRQLSKPSDNLIRFQNMVGLQLSSAACELINYGGLDRMCDYSRSHPADFVFQVGPAFNEVVPEMNITDPVMLLKLRKALWEEWKRQQVAFYSVSALDLKPTLKEFELATASGGIVLVSSDLLSADGAGYLFKPFFELKVGKEAIAILGFSESAEGVAGSWKWEAAVPAWKRVVAKLPAHITQYWIAGSLTPSTRQQLSDLADKPALFIGGDLIEPNHLKIQSLGRNFHFKGPDLGRGFAEMKVGAPGQPEAMQVGGLGYHAESFVLPKRQIQHKECLAVVPVTRTNQCSLKTLGEKVNSQEEPCE